MADVTYERKKGLSRAEAATWLSALADEVEAEFEVEISGDEVEVELEFSWSLPRSS